VRIALVAAPFIAVPPKAYGGTELFIAHLAEALSARGHDVIVYANGESQVHCRLRWLYAEGQWPLDAPVEASLRNLHHTAWAIFDAEKSGADVIHINDAVGIPLTRFVSAGAVHTLHHPQEAGLSELYGFHPNIVYTAISEFQRQRERMPNLQTVPHGLKLSDYRFSARKHGYLTFLGRIAPVKGTHIAIDVARRAGIPLKIAGEIQPVFREYWEREVKPHIDGRNCEYVGEATLDIKNELLGHSTALLFPIQWDEPFGLVMIEAMACGTPVLALPGGAVAEVVRPGVSGWICRDADELVRRARDPRIEPSSCRHYVERHFSLDLMVERYERVYRMAATMASAGRRRGRSPARFSPASVDAWEVRRAGRHQRR
jgi:glycosyltransferase involved in cell wall biosynthesis